MGLYEKLGHFSIMSLEERVKYAKMKARHQEIFKPWYRRWWGITIIIIATIALFFLILAGAYVAGRVQDILSGTAAEEPTTTDYAAALSAIKGDGSNYFMGPATSSPVTIIEFGDFACPYCRQSAQVVRAIAAEHPDEIKYIFRDYPLHDNSIDLALGARCAGEQGRFWEYYDEVFINKEETEATGTELRDLLMSLADEMGLNTAKYDQCLTDRRYILQIKKDYDDGELLKIAGTPTWFINNRLITGNIPEDTFRELINGLLQENNSQPK